MGHLSCVSLSHSLLPVPACSSKSCPLLAGEQPVQLHRERSAGRPGEKLSSQLGVQMQLCHPGWCLNHQRGCLCTSVGPIQTRMLLGLPLLASVSRSGSTGHNSARQQTAIRPVQDYIRVWKQFVSIFHLYYNIKKDRRRKSKPSV